MTSARDEHKCEWCGRYKGNMYQPATGPVLCADCIAEYYDMSDEERYEIEELEKEEEE